MSEDDRHITSTFSKGVITDLDVSGKKNESLLSAKNIRLFKDNNGLIVTNVAGNHYDEDGQIGFKIKDGYVPIGAIEFDGILYLCSCSILPVVDKPYHRGEIGYFPSYNENGILTREYRPLPNLMTRSLTEGPVIKGKFYEIVRLEDGDSFRSVGAPVDNEGIFFRSTGSLSWVHGSLLYEYGDFNTDELRFNPRFQVEMYADRLVDGSVRLLLNDAYNPIRSINNGFINGYKPSEIVYKETDFPNAVGLILSTNKQIIVDEVLVSLGGELLGGNYNFFLRFADRHLNHTHFCVESGIVQVNPGTTIKASEGSVKKTNKKVSIEIKNLDKSFYCVQVGYIRYYSDDTGVVVHETGLINNEYVIPKDESDDMIITIVGTEGTRVLTLDELIYERPEDDTCESIVPIENILWGCNWKGHEIFHRSMIDFAQLVTIGTAELPGYGVRSNVLSNSFVGIEESAASNAQYKDSDFTNNFLGYFRGEAYPFSIAYELNNGFITAGYPVKGMDELDPERPVNTKGIYRFPGNDTVPFYDGANISILSVKFYLDAAINAVRNSGDPHGLQWIKHNVRAIHFLRGNRHKTLEYQGLGILGCSAHTEASDDWTVTRMCSFYDDTIGMEDHQLQDNQDQYSTEGFYCQTAADFTDRSKIEGNGFWGCGGGLQENFDQYYPSTNVIPLYRGYAPMFYKDNDMTEDELGVRKVKVRNYMSRWFLKRNRLAVFSPDYMVGRLHDPQPIEKIERVFSTIPKTDVGDSDYSGEWSHDNINDGFSDIYPRWTKAEMEGIVASDPLEANDITVFSVGDESNNYPQSPSGEFVNYMKDFFTSDIETMFYGLSNNQNRVYTNRGVATPKYIGVNINEELSDSFNLDIVNLYNCDYRNLDITSFFPPQQSIRYSRIGQPFIPNFEEESIGNVINLYHGDCFIQRSYFKVNAYPGTAFYGEGWDTDISEDETVTDLVKTNARSLDGFKHASFSHGVVVGIVTENASNIAMRQSFLDHSYYPKVSSIKEFAKRCHSENRSESFLLNAGYNKIIGPREIIGYDPKFSSIQRSKPTTIRFSELNDPYSLIDGYRIFKEASRRNYPSSNGSMKKLMELNGFLVSIQERAINMHYINEKQAMSSPDSSEMIMGRGDILSDKVRILANYGSQHKLSICRTKDGIYGVDYNNRKLWRIGKSTDSYYSSLMAVDLSGQLLYSSKIKELFDRWDQFGDIAKVFGDSPIWEEGIFTVYDEANQEILFIFRSTSIAKLSNDSDIPEHYPIIANDE